MKKVLCLVLSLIMIFSCFGMCMTASAADYRYRPDGTPDAEGKLKPDLVGKVIDPILFGKNTSFADGINNLAYKSVINYAGSITDDSFDSFIAANANDSMFGVTMGYLYENNDSNFFWNSMKYNLELSGTDVHEAEVEAAQAIGKKSTCAAKGAYDTCGEVIYGYEYDYELKSTDKKIYESIVEVPYLIRNTATGRDETHYKYYYQFDKGNFALVKANANNQIFNTITKKYGDGAIFATPELANKNAIKIANFIGNLLYSDFIEIEADREIFTNNKTLKAEDFFRKVTELSGLDYILDEYWCNTKEFDVKKIMSALGVIVSDGAIFNIELEKGSYMGGRILTDIYREFTKNPVDYTLTVLQKFCRNYTATYQKAIERLFEMKFSVVFDKSHQAKYPKLDKYYGNELGSVDGLINFISDCIYIEKVDDGATNAGHFDFAPLPVAKFATATDIVELYLYMLCYSNINSIYEGNSAMIDSFINTVSAGNSETKTILNEMFKTGFNLPEIHSFYLGKLTGNTIENFPDNFTSTVRKAFAGFLQNLLEAMDNFMNLLFGWTNGLFGRD